MPSPLPKPGVRPSGWGLAGNKGPENRSRKPVLTFFDIHSVILLLGLVSLWASIYALRLTEVNH